MSCPGTSLTDHKKLRNARFKNNAQQQAEVATVNNGGQVVVAEGCVILGWGGVANYNLQKKHLQQLVQINMRAEKATIANELMMLEMSRSW